MPYSITTKDGITIPDIPDDVAPDAPELKAMVERIRAGQKPTEKPMASSQPQMSAADVAVSAVKNFPSSVGSMLGDIYEAVSSPVQTTKAVLDLGAGILQNALPERLVKAVGEDKESQKILQVLYNQGRGQNTIPHHVAKHIAGRAANGFSVVSCMFAIHYFFKSESSLDAFLGNVASNLRKNGIFITTFMDGDKVNALLTADKESKGVVEGRKLNGKVPIWAIIKRYDKFDKDNCWGKHVDVFLENTNKLIPEFVVNFDKLVEKAQNHGLALAEDGMFVDTFNNILAGARGKNRLSHLETSVLALEKDPVQTKFSFLNRWAVFKKM